MTIEIETERLVLKNYCENDLQNIYTLKSEKLVWIYSDKQVITVIEEAKKHLDGILKNYTHNIHDFQALFTKETQEYIGEAGILSFNPKHRKAVIGYNLLPKYWSKGYATEITIALIKYLFEELNAERIEALVCDENKASKNVLKKSGLLQEGLLRNFASINNIYVNVCYFGMIRQDYFGIHKIIYSHHNNTQ